MIQNALVSESLQKLVTLFIWFWCFSFRKTLQIDGPYDEVFYQKLLDLSTEDDGTVAFALRKVSRPIGKHHAVLGVFLPLPSTAVTVQNTDLKSRWLQRFSDGLGQLMEMQVQVAFLLALFFPGCHRPEVGPSAW